MRIVSGGEVTPRVDDLLDQWTHATIEGSLATSLQRADPSPEHHRRVVATRAVTRRVTGALRRHLGVGYFGQVEDRRGCPWGYVGAVSSVLALPRALTIHRHRARWAFGRDVVERLRDTAGVSAVVCSGRLHLYSTALRDDGYVGLWLDVANEIAWEGWNSRLRGTRWYGTGDDPEALPVAPLPFIDRAILGEFADPDEAIDDAILEWHRGQHIVSSLHQYLGLSWPEYARWMSNPRALGTIIGERIAGTDHAGPTRVVTNLSGDV